MAVECQVKTCIKDNSSTNGTTQDFTFSFTPKAVFVIANAAIVENTFVGGAILSYGFSDGTNHACVSARSRTAQATSDVGGSHRTDAVVCLQQATTVASVLFRATCSFLTNTVRFTYTVNNLNQFVMYVIAIGGSDITNVSVGTTNTGRTSTGIQSYTGLGFNPSNSPDSILFTLNNNTINNNSNESICAPSMGCAVSSSKRWCVSNCMEDARAASDTWKYFSSSRCLSSLVDTTGALDYLADFHQWITDGFELDYEDAPASASDKFSYMVIKGGKWDCGTELIRTTSGTETTTCDSSLNTMKGICMMHHSSTTVDSVSTNAAYCVGFSDGTHEGWTTFIERTAKDPTVSSFICDSDSHINSPVITNITTDVASLSWSSSVQSFGTNDFTINYSTSPGAAFPVGWWALGQTNIQDITKNVDDSYNVTDSIARLATRTRAIGDTYDVTDGITTIVNHIRNIGDTYNVTDVIARTQTLTRAIGDSYNVSDAVTRALTLTRLLLESYDVTDAIVRSFQTLKTLSDNYDVTDSINRLVTFTRLIGDTYDVLDSLIRSQTLLRQIGDTYDVTDALTRLKATTKELADNYNVSDSITREQELVRELEDVYDVIDSINRQVAFNRSLSDEYDVTDSVTRFQTLLRSIGDTYNVTDSISRQQELVRTLEEEYDVTDSVSNVASFIIDLSDEYEIDDSIIRSQSLTRNIGDTYNVTDLLTRLVVFARTVSDTYNVNDSLIRQILFSRILEEEYDVTDEIETEVTEPGNRIDVDLTEEYDIDDSVSRNIILQRLLEEAYNVSDSIQVEGGQPPLIIDEHLNIKGGAGGGIGLQPQLDKARKRIIKRVVMDLLPDQFPDEIYIDNQKAWFLNDKLETKVKEIRFTNDIKMVQSTSPFRITNKVQSIKEIEEREQLRIAIKQMDTNDYALKQFVNYHIPSTAKINMIEYGIRINGDLQPVYNDRINITNPITIKEHANIKLTNQISINKNIPSINIKSPLSLKSNSELKISNDLQINKNIQYNRITSDVANTKKTSIKEIKNLLFNKSNATYDKLLSNILRKNYSNTEDKEKLHYYLNYYQTRFDIEKTKTNQNMEKLDNRYSKKLEYYYDTIVNNYQIYNLPEAKEKYGKSIYDIIRSATQNGYNVGIDYVTRATGREDIYVTQQDLDNVKQATEKSYNHFWDSIEKSIKKKQVKEVTKDIPDLVTNNLNEIASLEAAILLMKSLTTGIVALATMDKIFQMGDIFGQQNIQPKFVFATERDALVCPDCTSKDFRLTGIEYTQNNYTMLPKPPIHFNCRCRVLLKLGNRIIVK